MKFTKKSIQEAQIKLSSMHFPPIITYKSSPNNNKDSSPNAKEGINKNDQRCSKNEMTSLQAYPILEKSILRNNFTELNELIN